MPSWLLVACTVSPRSLWLPRVYFWTVMASDPCVCRKGVEWVCTQICLSATPGWGRGSSWPAAPQQQSAGKHAPICFTFYRYWSKKSVGGGGRGGGRSWLQGNLVEHRSLQPQASLEELEAFVRKKINK